MYWNQQKGLQAAPQSAPFWKSSMKKLAVTGDSDEHTATSSCLFLEIDIEAEERSGQDMMKKLISSNFSKIY